MLEKFERIHLANLPTPLEDAPRFANETGLSKLLFKRDDLTGLAGGGNKARKLEFDFVNILKGGYDTVITTGGVQSNHARMTAAAARKLNLDIKLVLGGADFKKCEGNLLLDVLFDAEIRFLIDDDENDHLNAAMEKWADELREQGRKPYVIPIGGSTGLAALGYVNAMKELAEQFGQDKVQVVLTVGSCGTYAGVILGAKLFMPKARIIGVSVSRTAEAIKTRTLELIEESKNLLEVNPEINLRDVEIYENYRGTYGIPTEAGKKAVIDCARTEGIILDLVYTGKAMSGLIDLVRKQKIDKNIPVIFIHTGGFPSIFSFADEFNDMAKITKM
jgi:D-cysteine desulfhydrase